MSAFLALAFGMATALGYHAAKPGPLLRAAAELVASDWRPLYQSRELELAVVVQWLHDETGFDNGAIHVDDPGHVTYCAAQILNRPELLADPRGCVEAMLRSIHAYADLCGDDRAMAGYSSGSCDRAVSLAQNREREAWLVLELAR